MAIKGKSKGRTGRSVTPGPKPVYTPVKKPLLAKRAFWVTLGSILGVALLAGLVSAWLIQRDANAEAELEDRMRTAVSQYQGALAPILATVGQPIPPTSFAGFPELTNAVAALEEETNDRPVEARPIERTASDALESARNAERSIEEIDTTELISGRGFSEDFVLYVINSKANILRAMSLYQESALLVEMAAAAEGAEREQLTARARGVLDSASEVLNRGYSEFTQAQFMVGEAPPIQPPSPTGAS